MILQKFTDDYAENVKIFDAIFRVDQNFDLIKKVLRVGGDEATLYYIDGFVKDGIMQKLMMHFTSLCGFGIQSNGAQAQGNNANGKSAQAQGNGANGKSAQAQGNNANGNSAQAQGNNAQGNNAQRNNAQGNGANGNSAQAQGTDNAKNAALEFMMRSVPYVESDIADNVESAVQTVLSGATLMLATGFGACGIIIDSRTYPARDTGEPEGDKVMRGARDGFVETLIFNTALIRRRIRNPSLTMSYLSVGRDSRTDVVVCYMSDRADLKFVDEIKGRLNGIDTDALVMGHESLAECLIKSRWYNPFPKIRYTERPDSAAAQLLEGSVLIICDNSPEVMILPTSIFDFMQETNDFYFPPLTGSYIRLVRHAVFFLALFLIPLWYFAITHVEYLPEWLEFIVPRESGRLPIIVQLLLAEFIIDGLRMASLNTPNMLSNSLSVVGGLILGDFAVDIGWLIPEVILYMAFVAIANFTQRSYELGYAFKFMRMLLLVLVAIFGGWGLLGGVILVTVLIATNKTVNGKRSYLYPLIPFNGKALRSLFVRVKKGS